MTLSGRKEGGYTRFWLFPFYFVEVEKSEAAAGACFCAQLAVNPFILTLVLKGAANVIGRSFLEAQNTTEDLPCAATVVVLF